jgi:archaeosortase A (PGF-CTERM-specific)
MSDFLILAAFLLSCIFFLAGQQKKYAAIGGWTLIVINLFSEVPAYLKADNFLYPALALASLPFLLITVRHLLRNDPVVLQLSKTAAVAIMIYVPFAFVPVFRDALVMAVVNQAFWIIQFLGHHPQMPAWNIIMENGFANQIILGCTGITAIAIMTGVIAGVPRLPWKQGVPAFLIIIPLLYVLNLLRVAIVFIAVSDAWFWFLPDITGNSGFRAADFFWAHNVFAEALAVMGLLAITFGLSRMIPALGIFARRLAALYTGDIMAFFREGSGDWL